MNWLHAVALPHGPVPTRPIVSAFGHWQSARAQQGGMAAHHARVDAAPSLAVLLTNSIKATVDYKYTKATTTCQSASR